MASRSCSATDSWMRRRAGGRNGTTVRRDLVTGPWVIRWSNQLQGRDRGAPTARSPPVPGHGHALAWPFPTRHIDAAHALPALPAAPRRRRLVGRVLAG